MATPDPVITGCFTLAGVVIGAGITYVSATRLADRASKKATLAKFREAFNSELAPILEELERGRVLKRLQEILDQSLSKHVLAIREVNAVLSKKQQAKLDQAWQKHCFGTSKMRFHQYCVPEVTTETMRLAVSNIEAITSCAKP